jgi:hypothetical protein
METPETSLPSLPKTPAPAGPGRIVHYRLTADDAAKINRRRTNGPSIAGRIRTAEWPEGAQAHIGNVAIEGDYLPMMVVRCWDGGDLVNGQVFLDGNDQLWVTSVPMGTIAGTWCWPPRAQ